VDTLIADQLVHRRVVLDADVALCLRRRGPITSLIPKD
jgi:hypothetical protein